MVVCIVGSMRSGTSMITNLLRRSGLYLGADADLLPPSPDNPEGFWENARFVALNDAILKAFGGVWHYPPTFATQWERDDRLQSLRTQAAQLVGAFANRTHWGWKDPRTSLTLPFWRQFFPTMRVVLCVRNPLEVAESLRYRQWFPRELGVQLWYQYNQAVLDAVPPGQLIVTQYDTFFRDPQGELRRLLRFLGMPETDEMIAYSCAAISPRLRHHRCTNAHLAMADAAPPIIALYEELARMAVDSDRSHPRHTPVIHGTPFRPTYGSQIARVYRDAIWPFLIQWNRLRATYVHRRGDSTACAQELVNHSHRV